MLCSLLLFWSGILSLPAASQGDAMEYSRQPGHIDSSIGHRSGGDWANFIGHLNATLDAFQVPQQERSEVLSFVESTKGDIVEV